MDEATYVAVTPKVLEELDLTQGALGEDLLAKDVGDFLDGNPLPGLIVVGSANVQVSPRSITSKGDATTQETYQTMP